ncbi:MAG: MerR family transcriptional regulator [Candidatus Omnitrophica bacterium]|nr:MerR family transcriptional regulator [Candidatus Omnitrophota bacterium]
MLSVKKQVSRKLFDEVLIGPDDPVYTSGVVCRILDIPIWVLKQLDTAGVVSPPREYEGKARLYSKRELKMVQHCWFYLKEHKVKISGLKVILQIESGTFKAG